MLGYFRSYHANQSWLTALVAIMDMTALIMMSSDRDLRTQASLTFAMGRHALADLRATFGLKPVCPPPDRLGNPEFARLRETVAAARGPLQPQRMTEAELRDWREMYEPDAGALADHFLMTLPTWLAHDSMREKWRTSLREREKTPFAVSDPFREESGD